MSKYRCPVCGATHRDMPDQCRLCGQKMGEGSIVGDFSGAREVVVQKKGLGGIMLGAIALVAVIAIVLAVAGIGPGGNQVDQVINRAPIPLRPRADGWSELRDDAGHFQTDLPSNGREQKPQNEKAVALFGAGATADAWQVRLGADAIIDVTYTKLPKDVTAGFVTNGTVAPDGGRNRIRSLTQKYLDAQTAGGAKQVRNDDVGFVGVAAQYLELRNVASAELKNNDAYEKVLLFYVDATEMLYTIRVTSVFPLDKIPQYDLVTQNFALI